MNELELHVGGRGGGKTRALIDWLKAAPAGEHRVLVSHSRAEAMRLLREVGCPAGLESWQFVSVDEVKSTTWAGVLMGRGGRIVLGVDNLDLVLPRLLAWPVGRVTASGKLVD